MSLPSKVLWAEGLSLGPQLFQQLDRYHEARLQRISSAINPDLWGVRALGWNIDRLSNGKLASHAMSLIFQDGEIYEAPGPDELPVEVDLGKLPLSELSFTFYAALPVLKEHGGNLTDPDPNAIQMGARYTQNAAETVDLFTDGISLDVAYLRKRVQLLSHLEPRDDYVSFPVVRVRRMDGGGFEIDPTFMPPSLSVGALAGLPFMLSSLLGRLQVKIESLYARHRQSSKDVFEAHSGDIASFWMLHTLSTAAASLNHCARYRQHHPEFLFDKLSALAGGLMTFSSKYALADLPAYRHDDPAPGFIQLDAIVRDLSDVILSSKYLPIPLEHDEERISYFYAKLDSPKIDRNATLYLAARFDMPAHELVAAVPGLVKIASPDKLDELIRYSLYSVKLTHMPQVPPEVPVRPNTCYFSLERNSDLYENMLKAQAVMIYAAATLDGIELELFAITA
ncbi:type VI secretion system baseplate subunit TssK [Janthinobacterium sp. BJB412]|nr:type VI secretion system baseplate subunit TssK [Janthinobacterium sp. BJB412]